MPQYTVIESTPGYLPEDDDPAVFDELSDALVYASDRLSNLLDHIYDGQVYGTDEGYTGWKIVGTLQDDHSVVVYDNSRTHDLGRVIAVVEYEEGR